MTSPSAITQTASAPGIMVSSACPSSGESRKSAVLIASARAVLSNVPPDTVQATPAGTYTVTEVTAWSSRYEPDEVSKEVTLVYSDTILNNNQVTFTNTMNKKQWLDGNGYTENVFRTVTAAPEAGN